MTIDNMRIHFYGVQGSVSIFMPRGFVMKRPAPIFAESATTPPSWQKLSAVPT
jgi:hypothetical protein